MTKTKKSAPRNTSLAVPETPSAAPAAPLSEQSSTTSAAASEAVASASEGTPAATPIVLLELNRIVCSTYNPRRNLNESSLDELALSMQQTGQLQPICVRGSGEHYEIVYGERRYRAAQRAGFTHIKALVYEHLTDEDAEDMAITENLQREDVAPLEEAAAFLRALKTGRHTVTTLVDKFGKSERYIRSHLKLNDLIEPLANLLEREEIIESMAIELAKYPSEVQQCVFEEHFANDGHNSWKNTSPRQVGQYLLDRYMTKLNTYKFDKTECSTCAENTANNILFSELAEGCAGCENRACMIRKNDEFLVEKAIRMQRNDPRTLLAVEVGRYSDAVLERLTSQGYTVEVIDTYSMWEPDVPVLPDVEAPRESDYEDRDEYLEALAEYESEVSEYRENMKKLDAEIDTGRVHKYALIGMLDVDLFYEEVPEQIEETSDDKGVTVYTSIAPRPIVEELESRIVMAHRSCYTQMTTDLKRVLRETEISSSALAASESRLYGYSLLRLLPSSYAEKLGLEREALQDVQQIGDFLDHLDGDRMNMLMRSVIFNCMDHIEEFRQTDETFELQLLRQFALQHERACDRGASGSPGEDAIQTRRAASRFGAAQGAGVGRRGGSLRSGGSRGSCRSGCGTCGGCSGARRRAVRPGSVAGSVSIACGITVINNVDTGRSGYPLLPAFYSLTKTNTIMTKPSEHFRDTIREYLEQRAGADALFAASCAKEHKNLDDCITFILNYVQQSGCNGFTDAEIYSLAVHYYDEDDIDVGRPLDCRVVVNHTIVLTEEEQREAHEQALRKATEEAYAKITHKSKSQPASNAANAANQQSLF